MRVGIWGTQYGRRERWGHNQAPPPFPSHAPWPLSSSATMPWALSSACPSICFVVISSFWGLPLWCTDAEALLGASVCHIATPSGLLRRSDFVLCPSTSLPPQYLSLLLAAPDSAVVLAALQTLAACVRKSSAPTARYALLLLLPVGLCCCCRLACCGSLHRRCCLLCCCCCWLCFCASPLAGALGCGALGCVYGSPLPILRLSSRIQPDSNTGSPFLTLLLLQVGGHRGPECSPAGAGGWLGRRRQYARPAVLRNGCAAEQCECMGSSGRLQCRTVQAQLCCSSRRPLVANLERPCV